MQLQDPRKQKEFLRKFQNINRRMEEEEASNQAVALGLSYIDLGNFPLDLNAIALLSKEQAIASDSVVFYKDGQDVRIGTANPSSLLLKKIVQEFEATKKYKIQQYFISRSSLNHILDQYIKIELPEEKHSLELIIEKGHDYAEEVKGLNKPEKVLSATEILTWIFGAAEQLGASDVHCEPEEQFVKIRLRLDGVLNEVARLPKEYQKPMTSRVKVLSKLKLNVENVPQDGRFSYQSSGNLIDVRVSTLPSAYGEVMVMRILGNQAVDLKLDDLGFSGKSYEVIKEELNKPNGMIITTGPTGSGKTTTLYAFLNQLNQPGVNIITLEDPVEYKLEGINQTPIDHNSGLDFASGLRAILRQDPDVIMVGEVRDQETAEVSLQAALTGHVVLSTLHTNDAAGAIPRLLNMGVKPFVIAPALNAIIAQRLVRKLCTECKEEKLPDPFILEKVKRILDQIPKSAEVTLPAALKFFHSKGCANCNNLGYKGRIGIYEVIPKSQGLEKLIMQSAGSGEIKSYAAESGMVTMVQDGLLKALQGITDVEEVFRVAQE
jgi:type IV pilus assembly protein PilB